MRTHLAAVLALLLSAALTAESAAAAAWTDRGSRTDGGRPANGRFDLRQTLRAGEGRDSGIAPLTLNGVVVKDGSFAVDIDFGVELSGRSGQSLLTELAPAGGALVALGVPKAFDPQSAFAGVCWDGVCWDTYQVVENRPSWPIFKSRVRCMPVLAPGKSIACAIALPSRHPCLELAGCFSTAC